MIKIFDDLWHGPTITRVIMPRFLQEFGEGRRHVGRHVGPFATGDTFGDLKKVNAVKGTTTGKTFPNKDAERVDIGSWGETAVNDGLGRHPADGAQIVGVIG